MVWPNQGNHSQDLKFNNTRSFYHGNINYIKRIIIINFIGLAKNLQCRTGHVQVHDRRDMYASHLLPVAYLPEL